MEDREIQGAGRTEEPVRLGMALVMPTARTSCLQDLGQQVEEDDDED